MSLISKSAIGARTSSPLPLVHSMSVATSLACGRGQGRGGKRIVQTLSAASRAAATGISRVPDPTDRRARLVRGAARAWTAKEVADAVVAEVEREWEEHLGKRRMKQLREALILLREITDPWAAQEANKPSGQANGGSA
ncbi:hypothetical protein [Streptomyces sp. P17]|uniref:hypothetical protein n=1 Tax=Streptomyces sp. P17 TaxID=3074716 RepID=UPI0028F3F137|nr:hypothetical protein [Streptomyces sp. P17]MDT9700648.1 hypothetical protein [Streptomyces sp. P17]